MVYQSIHRNVTAKTVYSAICCSTSFLLGWFLKLTGPSLLELQLNTEVTFTMASSYITLFNVTQIIGSLGVGFFLYKKVNALLLIATTLVLAAASAVAIPLCLAYIPMLFSHVGFGLAVGALDMLMIAEMSALWGSDTEVPMHALYFTSSIGSVLSPICTTPYLKNLGDIYVSSESEIFDSPINSSTLFCNNLSIAQLETTECIMQQALEAPSRLHIPYGISAGLSVTISFTTMVIFILYTNNKFKVTYYHNEDKKEVSGKFLFVVLLVTGLMSGLDTSIEESSADFLPSFCVTHMGWNSQTSAYTVSVFGISILIGRFVGIILTAASFSSIKLMASYCLLLITAYIVLIISGTYSLDYGIWISSFLSGFGTSVLSPCIFAITENLFFPVSGKIAAYFVMIASLGSGLNSLLIGYLMESISTMYFCYILLIESVAYLVLTICIVTISAQQNAADESHELVTNIQRSPMYS